VVSLFPVNSQAIALLPQKFDLIRHNLHLDQVEMGTHAFLLSLIVPGLSQGRHGGGKRPKRELKHGSHPERSEGSALLASVRAYGACLRHAHTHRIPDLATTLIPLAVSVTL
jgi:hypothetical protein